jgi:putative DNA primase/helicase
MFRQAAERVAEVKKRLEGAGEEDEERLNAELKRWQSVQAWAVKSEDARRVRSMIDLARCQLAITPDRLNRDPWLLNCANGTLDLRTGELREHRREDYITQLCPTPYDPAAGCPTWERFLGSVFPAAEVTGQAGNPELIRFVQRLLGYGLTGDVREQVLPFFWGDGANGKSTLLNAVREALGADYCGKAPPGLLLAHKGDRHPTELADLFGRRLALANETPEGGRFNESQVKDLTGGDPISARRMREDFWQFDPTHKLIVCGNHKPRVTGTDHGIWRRIRLVPFAVRFWNPDDQPAEGEQRPEHLRQDKDLPARLRAEAPGVLAWMMRGCLDWQRNGLGSPHEVQSATAGYRAEQDLIGEFIADCCLTGPATYRVRAKALYAAFRKWVELAGERHPPSQREFGLAMTGRGVERQTSNGVWYVGIALRDE